MVTRSGALVWAFKSMEKTMHTTRAIELFMQNEREETHKFIMQLKSKPVVITRETLVPSGATGLKYPQSDSDNRSQSRIDNELASYFHPKH